MAVRVMSALQCSRVQCAVMRARRSDVPMVLLLQTAPKPRISRQSSGTAAFSTGNDRPLHCSCAAVSARSAAHSSTSHPDTSLIMPRQ